MMLTLEQAKQFLDYDPESGVLTWKAKPPNGNKIRVGDVACYPDGGGYLSLMLMGKNYRAHRLAWLLMNGEWPAGQIDHINGKRQDNRWVNLRSVSDRENKQNMKRRADNKSGVTGVRWEARDMKWRAHITVNRNMIELGRFSSFDDAVSARKCAEKKYGFHENHGRSCDTL